MKAKDLHYKTTGKQRKHMCWKGKFCLGLETGNWDESQVDDL